MIISPDVIEELEQALARSRGRELGGLLLEGDAGNRRIRLAPNLMAEPGSFEAPVWWFESMLGKRDRDRFLPVAFFHSHTSSLDLSERDRESMKHLRLPWIVTKREAGTIVFRVYPSFSESACRL